MDLSRTGLIGTLPALGFSGMISLQTLKLSQTAVSGSIPNSIGGLPYFQTLEAAGAQLSGSLPTGLCSPEAGASASALAVINLRGNVLDSWPPSLLECRSLLTLDLTGNHLSRLPSNVPTSLLHLYLGGNPIASRAKDFGRLLSTLPLLHAFEIDLDDAPTQLNMNMSVLLPPRDCRVGGACAFRLELHDTEGQRIHSGGHVTNLTLRLFPGEWQQPMVDNQDGSFAASVPENWIRTAGQRSFRFFHGSDEFSPSNVGFLGSDELLPANVVDFGKRCARNQLYDVKSRTCACEKGTYDIRPRGYICCFAGSVTEPSIDVDRRCSDVELLLHSHIHDHGDGDDGLCMPCPPCAICSTDGTFSVADGFKISRSSQIHVPGIQASESVFPIFKCPHDNLARAGCNGWIEQFDAAGTGPVGTRMDPSESLDIFEISSDRQCADACCQHVACKSFDFTVDNLCQLNKHVSAQDRTNVSSPGTRHFERPFACHAKSIGAGVLNSVQDSSCLSGYTGPLCGACALAGDQQYVNSGTDSGESCIACDDYIVQLKSFSIWLFVIGVVLTAIGIATAWAVKLRVLGDVFLRYIQDRGVQFVAALKVLITFKQVVTIVFQVLDSRLDSVNPQHAYFSTPRAWYQLLFGQVWLLIQPVCFLDFLQESPAWVFYLRWLSSVVVLPAVISGAIAAMYRHARRKDTHRRLNAMLFDDASEGNTPLDGARRQLYIALFLFYPATTCMIFDSFNCRHLALPSDDDCEAYLVQDYNVSCCSTSFAVFRMFAVIVALLIPIGVPIGFAVILWQAKTAAVREISTAVDECDNTLHQHDPAADAHNVARARSSSVLALGLQSVSRVRSASMYTLHAFQHAWTFRSEWMADPKTDQIAVRVHLSKHYLYLIFNYKDSCYWWELVDCLYKLLMAAIFLLLPFNRGSRFQLFTAALVSFGSAALHVAAWPYRRNEDNWLRLAVETEIFMIIIVAMAIGHQSSSHPNYEEVQMFASILQITTAGLLIVAVAVASHKTGAIHRNRTQSEVESQGLFQTLSGSLIDGSLETCPGDDGCDNHMCVLPISCNPLDYSGGASIKVRGRLNWLFSRLLWRNG